MCQNASDTSPGCGGKLRRFRFRFPETAVLGSG